MSGDYIRLELQTEIMKRLPVKSLMKFRSVSKTWKSIIHSSQFISDYKKSTHQLLVCYYNRDDVYTIDGDDDNSFPPHKFLLKLHFGKAYRCMIGCSQGLFGFCIYDHFHPSVAVIWNHCIRKSVDIPVPNRLPRPTYATVFGFGVCNATDPVIVKINYIDDDYELVNISSIPLQVEVFSLTTGAWRTLSNSHSLPRKSLRLTRKVVAIDRFIYWLAYDRTPEGDYLDNLILSFDITSEDFTELSHPSSLASTYFVNMGLFKLRESLVVLKTNRYANIPEFGVWMMMMMEDGVQSSFKKLYTVNGSDASLKRVLGFRKNGQPIIVTSYGTEEQSPLLGYEPDSERFNDIGSSIMSDLCPIGSYMFTGTLLLLDH